LLIDALTVPRNRICAAPPIWPERWRTEMPGDCAWSIVSMLTGTSTAFVRSTTLTAFPTSRCLAPPAVPVTTICSSMSVCFVIGMFTST
jgi:hypothetical protein